MSISDAITGSPFQQVTLDRSVSGLITGFGYLQESLDQAVRGRRFERFSASRSGLESGMTLGVDMPTVE